MNYNVDQYGRIADPGKFEGEPLYVLYFWQAALDGFDEIGPNGESIFRLTDTDRKRWPDLEGCVALVLWETDNGFIHHSTFDTEEKLDRAIAIGTAVRFGVDFYCDEDES